MAGQAKPPNRDMAHRRTYLTWRDMIRRCTKPGHFEFRDYGARGITVCEQWRTYQGFLDDMGIRPIGLSIDRINNDGNYEPGNCRWATAAEQARNKRPYRKRPPERRVPCFACGKPITTDRGLHPVDTRDAQWVYVGHDCFKKVAAAGADGYQPPKGGPRLWLCEPTRARAA